MTRTSTRRADIRGRRGVGHRPGRASALAAIASAAMLMGCSPDDLPPLPEALIVVDIDALVPRLVDRLRVDFYRDNGTWLESRDIPRRDPRDWPASFSVYGEHESEGGTVLLRLRAYRDGKVRDYRGERFMARPLPGDPGELVPWPPPPPGETPRLERDGKDVTPATEPLPNLAIDRLVRVELEPGVRGSVGITLSGACLGTMAELDARTTCVATENERVAVNTEPLDDDISPPRVSASVGTFGASIACTRTPRIGTSDPTGIPMHDEEVCVPGGAFVLGSADVTGLVVFDALESTPERVAVIPPLLVDQYEVTVARWHRARREGFEPLYDPYRNDADAPLPATSGPSNAEFCTYSREPLAANSRETYPVNCVGWDEARAFCRFEGGDLLTEAQWEYVATATGENGETLFPWGNDPPSCDAQVYSREVEGDFCFPGAYGPAPAGTGAGDVSPRGVHDLGGSVEEWVLDSPRPFDARCWASVGLADPRCSEDDVPERGMRGSSWGTGRALLSALRPGPLATDLVSKNIGFRCARPGAGPTP
jgi:formylglycine-generating enzyme required for sulfatase activity